MHFLFVSLAGQMDGLPGVAGGWATAGMLVGVVGWLMYVAIPAQQKASKEASDAKDALVAKMIGDFRDELHLERDANNANIRRQQDQDASTTKTMADLLLQNTEETRKLAAVVGNLAERVHQTKTEPPSALPGALPPRAPVT